MKAMTFLGKTENCHSAANFFCISVKIVISILTTNFFRAIVLKSLINKLYVPLEPQFSVIIPLKVFTQQRRAHGHKEEILA
jgi:hypothetical protein